MLDSKLKDIIKELYSIPNAPYSTKLRSEYIRSIINKANLEYTETPYYIYTKLNSAGSKKIVFITHLDHPGFVFKNSKEAIALGSLYLHKVKNFAPISVYNLDGKYLGDVTIKKVFGRDESKIEVNSNFDIPKNSSGLWKVGDVNFTQDKIFGRSHDNDIVTSILLNNLKRIESSEFEIVFVFTKHEEILQQSSYTFAKENPLKINKNDIIINLESMKVYPTTNKIEYSNLNYDNGIVLNIAEATCIYGQSFTDRNLAESLINNLVKEISITIQRGLAGGTSDARPIAAFNLTPNIVTLNVPNMFKHNSDGIQIVAEEVKVSDIINLDLVIKSILEGNNSLLIENQLDISKIIKSEFPTFNKDVSMSYLALNKRLDIANKSIIKREHFFAENIIETINDIFLKLHSYIQYFLTSKSEKTVSKD